MKNTKRGFTIVELVIVIAVIAILAAILIPVFSNVIETANESSRKAEIKNAYSKFVADEALGSAANKTDAEYGKIDAYVYVDEAGNAYDSEGKAATKPSGAALKEDINGWDIYAA